MRVLARLEGAPPTPSTIDVLVSISPAGPSIAPSKLAMIHVGPFSVPKDPPITIMISPRTSHRVWVLSLRFWLFLYLLNHPYETPLMCF